MSTTALQSVAPIRVVIYARYSSDLQDQKSIDSQFLVCREYAARQPNWVVVGTYKDEAISGESLKLRSGMRALLTDAKRDQFDVVLAADLDRMSRSQRDMADIYDRLSFADVKIYTLADNEVDEVRSGFRGIMSAMFLKNLAANIHRGQHQAVLAGKSVSRLAYGYEVLKHTDAAGEPIRGDRKIILFEAEVIVQALTEYARGISPIKIVRRLNAAKPRVPGPDGGDWTVDSIRGSARRGTGLINNELYIGIRIWNRTRLVKNPDTGKRVKRSRPVEEWDVTEVPELRIVSDELWDAVKDRQRRYSGEYAQFVALASAAATDYNHGGALNTTHRPGSIFAGQLVCGHCGGTYSTRGQGRYVCTNHRDAGTCANGRSITREELETRVLRAFLGPLTEPKIVADSMRTFADQTHRLHLEERSSHNASRKKLKETEKSLHEITAAMEAGGYSRTLNNRLRELEEIQDKLEKRLSSALPMEVSIPSASLFRSKAENLAEAMSHPEEHAEAVERSVASSAILRQA